MLYLSEVSHHHAGKAYCFRGELYIDPIFPKYQVRAFVSATPNIDPKALRNVEIPNYSAIDYYAMIDADSEAVPAAVDTVVFGFQGQAFATRAFVVGIKGVASGTPSVTTIENPFGEWVNWIGSQIP